MFNIGRNPDQPPDPAPRVIWSDGSRRLIEASRYVWCDPISSSFEGAWRLQNTYTMEESYRDAMGVLSWRQGGQHIPLSIAVEMLRATYPPREQS